MHNIVRWIEEEDWKKVFTEIRYLKKHFHKEKNLMKVILTSMELNHHQPIVSVLQIPDVNPTFSDNKLLYWAFDNNYPSIIRLLLDNKAVLHHLNHRLTLKYLIEFGDLQLFKLFIKNSNKKAIFKDKFIVRKIFESNNEKFIHFFIGYKHFFVVDHFFEICHFSSYNIMEKIFKKFDFKYSTFKVERYADFLFSFKEYDKIRLFWENQFIKNEIKKQTPDLFCEITSYFFIDKIKDF